MLMLACSGSSADPMNDGNDDGPVDVPEWACVPGETQPCDCSAELPGVRTCNPEGSGFGECDCSPEAMSQGPPATSTGTGGSSGTGSDTAGTDSTAGPMTDGPGTTTMPDPTTDEGGSSSTGPGPGSTSGGSSSTG